MKTIAERAREFREIFSEASAFVKSLAEVAYKEGATKQRAIDNAKLRKLKSAWEKEVKINTKENYKQGYHDAIENACEYFDNYFMEIGYPDDWLRDSPNIESGKERFRKAMEE